MKVVQPIEVTSAMLTSTNVVNIEADWTAGTYNLGQRRVYNDLVYEVVADPNTSDQPDTGAAADPPSWLLIGSSNEWRMFRDGADSQSTATGDIEVVIDFGQTINTLAVFGIEASTIQVIVDDYDEGEVYNETVQLADIGVGTWWDFFFTPYDTETIAFFDDLPPYPDSVVTIIVAGVDAYDAVAVGRVVGGVSNDLGVTNYNTAIRLQDYSIKERDGFGNLRLVPRRTLRLVDYDVTVETTRIDSVVRKLQRLSAVPALYVGDESVLSTITFGIFTDVAQGITTPSISDLTIQVEEF